MIKWLLILQTVYDTKYHVYATIFFNTQLIMSKTCKHLDFPLLIVSLLFICAEVDPFSISNVDLINQMN